MTLNVVSTIVGQLGFASHAVHTIPSGLPEHDLCGSHALAFLAHVIVGMQLPTTVGELRTLHTNMRASFVAHLYAVTDTPQPVIWVIGPSWESGPLPIMPEADPWASNCCAFSALPGECSPRIWDFMCCCVGRRHPDRGEIEAEIRQHRGTMIRSHATAMGDDEVLFHLQHIMHCLQCRPFDGRQFVILPPLFLHALLQGDPEPISDWIDELNKCSDASRQTTMIIRIDHHWVPAWISPGIITMCHTLADFVDDHQLLQEILAVICHDIGIHDFVIHQVPHGLPPISCVGFQLSVSLRTLSLEHRCHKTLPNSSTEGGP